MLFIVALFNHDLLIFSIVVFLNMSGAYIGFLSGKREIVLERKKADAIIMFVLAIFLISVLMLLIAKKLAWIVVALNFLAAISLIFYIKKK